MQRRPLLRLVEAEQAIVARRRLAPLGIDPTQPMVETVGGKITNPRPAPAMQAKLRAALPRIVAAHVGETTMQPRRRSLVARIFRRG